MDNPSFKNVPTSQPTDSSQPKPLEQFAYNQNGKIVYQPQSGSVQPVMVSRLPDEVPGEDETPKTKLSDVLGYFGVVFFVILCALIPYFVGAW